MEDEEEEGVAAAEAERRRYGDKMLLCDIEGWRPGSETTPDPGAVAVVSAEASTSRGTHKPHPHEDPMCVHLLFVF